MLDHKPIFILQNPKLDEAEKVIRAAISNRRLVFIAGSCKAEYHGRANSTLEAGERIVILKQDGALLVHRPLSYEPVNWQPSGSILHVSEKDGFIQIMAVRNQPREVLTVYFDNIIVLASLGLVDKGKFILHASEKDMQKAILIKPSIIERGFKTVSYEKKIEPGFIDVYGIDSKGRIVVLELKRKTAVKKDVLQLSRYVSSVEELLGKEIRGILVAPQFSRGVQKLLTSLGLEYKILNPKLCSRIIRESTSRKIVDFL